MQKDQFKAEDGRLLTETAFWRSDLDEAEVEAFKRAKALCSIAANGGSEEFSVHVHLRSNVVRVFRSPRFGARLLAKALQIALMSFFHTPGYNPQGVLQPIYATADDGRVTCKTYNGSWIAGVLHDIKDEGGVETQLDDALES